MATKTSTKHIEETAADAKANRDAQDRTVPNGMNEAPKWPTHDRRRAIVNALKKELTADLNGIHTANLPTSVENALRMLALTVGHKETGESVQRMVEWSHVIDLARMMRICVENPDANNRWYQGVNMGVISAELYNIDSRHRWLAYIMAFGTVEEIDAMMRILGGHDSRPANVSEEDVPLMKPDVRGWSINPAAGEDRHLEPPVWAFPISIGADPDSFALLNSHKLDLTPVQALQMSPISSQRMARMGIADNKVYATALRMAYLRTQKPTTNAKGEVSYGSLGTGGGIGPERYPVYDYIFGDDLEKAIGLVETHIKTRGSEDTDYAASNVEKLGEHLIYLAVMLAQKAGLSYGKDKELRQFLDDICNGTAEKNTAAAWLRKYLADGKKFKYRVKAGEPEIVDTLRTTELFAAIVLAITDREATYSSNRVFVAALKKEPNALRFAGLDTDGLEPEALSAAEIAVTGRKRQSANKYPKKPRKARK